MPQEELPPDPEWLEKWQKLPQNKPSHQALPPVAGGTRWSWWLLGGLGLIVLIGLILQLFSS